MNDLKGFEIDQEFLPKFTWVRNIHYYDGPLTSEYTSEKGDIYIFHWCDEVDDVNLWLVARVSRRSLIEFNAGIIPTLELLTSRNQDRNPLILAIDTDGEMTKAKYVPLSALPDEYLPDTDAFIEPSLMPDNEGDLYAILLNGEWQTETLVKVQRRLIDLYSITFQSDRDSVEIPNSPMRDGYSSYHFWKALQRYIPVPAKLNRIVYESPGYIEFSADNRIFLQVKQNVDHYLANEKTIQAHYEALKNYIRNQGLNKDSAPPPTSEQSKQLSQLSASLLEFFEEPKWSWLNKNMGNSFKVAKAAQFYFERILYIADLVNEGQVVMAEI